MGSSSDQRGLELTAESIVALEAFDRTITHFLGLKSDAGECLKSVLEADGEMPMAHCLEGYFMKLLCSAPCETKARESSMAANAFSAKYSVTEREQAHIDALAAWTRGDLIGARDRWESILISFPLDVLALRISHFIHFYLGDASGLRDLFARLMVSAGLKAGRFALVCALLAEQLGQNPASAWSWSRLRDAFVGLDDRSGAEHADDRCRQLLAS